eukprot:7619496-Alexandrium_andersonii.AAC.1
MSRSSSHLRDTATFAPENRFISWRPESGRVRRVVYLLATAQRPDRVGAGTAPRAADGSRARCGAWTCQHLLFGTEDLVGFGFLGGQ